MAKFYLTNSKKWFESTLTQIEESDFKLSFSYSKNDINVAAVHKLKINNVNAVSQNEKFVVAVGTAIYKESLNYSPILETEDINIEQIRKDTIGQYAYAVKNNNTLKIFTDGVGVYDVYYYIHNDEWYIATSLYDLARIIRPNLTLNELNLFERAAMAVVLNNETVFNEVKRLNGDQYIEIKNGKLRVVNDMTHAKYPLLDDKKYPEIVEELARRLVYKASVIKKVMGAPAIGMTGGVDSRTNLAVFLAAQANPKLVYVAPSNSLIDNQQNDIIIATKLSQKFNVEYYKQDVDTSHPENDWDANMGRYGFLYNHWGGVSSVIDFFANLDSQYLTFGLGGEFYRTYDKLIGRREKFSFNELESFYANFHGKVSLVPYQIEGYKNHIRAKIHKVLKKYNVDEDNISPEDIFYLLFEYRKIADMHHVLRKNLLKYCSFLLMEADCIELCRIANGRLDNGSFMLDVLKLLYPAVLSIPFVSQHVIMGYDARTNSLISRKDMNRRGVLRRLKSIYTKHKQFLKPIRDWWVRKEKINADEFLPDGASMKDPIYVDNKWEHVVSHHISFVGLGQEYNTRYALDCKLLDSLGFNY